MWREKQLDGHVTRPIGACQCRHTYKLMKGFSLLGKADFFTIIAAPLILTGPYVMTEEQASPIEQSAEQSDDADTTADTKAIIVMFIAATLMAVHFISGFNFDF